MAKFRKIFIGHAAGSNYTEVGFFTKSALERGKWYGGNKPISDASMSRLSRLIDDEVIQISNVYPLSKQLWVVYQPTATMVCEHCGNTLLPSCPYCY